MKFDSLFQIERYIEETYQLSGRVYPSYFQIQFISASVNTDDPAIIRYPSRNYFRRMKRQQKRAKKNLQEKQNNRSKKNSQKEKMHANFKCSPRHEELRKADKICKKSRARKLNFGADNRVAHFCS